MSYSAISTGVSGRATASGGPQPDMARIFSGALGRRHAGGRDVWLQWKELARSARTSVYRGFEDHRTIPTPKSWTSGTRNDHRRSEGLREAVDGEPGHATGPGFGPPRVCLQRKRKGPSAHRQIDQGLTASVPRNRNSASESHHIGAEKMKSSNVRPQSKKTSVDVGRTRRSF